MAQYMGPETTFSPAIHVNYDAPWERRDLLGVHPQKQPGLCWVGASVPAGRINAQDFEEFAAVAEKYGDGTVRLTCEENILFVNVPEEKVPEMLTEPVFLKFKVNPGKHIISHFTENAIGPTPQPVTIGRGPRAVTQTGRSNRIGVVSIAREVGMQDAAKKHARHVICSPVLLLKEMVLVWGEAGTR